jgi:secreted trypsin-like serine protease
MKFLYKIILPVILFVSVSLGLSVNSNDAAHSLTNNSITNQPSNRADLNKLKKEIDREIGKPRARRINQCRVIAFGAKACGGPKTYLVYSSLQTNENKLKRLVGQYNSLEDKINKETDAISDCMFIEEPKPTIQNGMCKIRRN